MHCKDTWKRQIPEGKLKAYNQLLHDGIISNPHVTYSRAEKITIVEYDSEHDQDWIRKELAQRV